MDFKKIYPKSVKTRKGREIVLKMPEIDHLKELQRFINELVEENVPILKNEKVNIEDEKKYLEGLLKKIDENKSVNIFAFYESELIASTGIRREKFRKEHIGNFGISISKDFRNEGLGHLLMEEVLKLAKDQLKLKIIILEVFRGNKAGRHLYEKFGFKEYGRLPQAISYKDKYEDAILMYKES